MAKNKGLCLVNKPDKEHKDKIVSLKARREFEAIAASLKFNVAFQLSCLDELPVMSEEQIDDFIVCMAECENFDQEE